MICSAYSARLACFTPCGSRISCYGSPITNCGIHKVRGEKLEDKLLTVDEVAELLRLPRTQVYRLQRRGDIAAVKISRRTLFTREQVNQFIRLNTTLVK